MWLLLVGMTCMPACSCDGGDSVDDDAGPADGFVDPTSDADGDGLCAGTEAMYGTSPDEPDTDSDGFPDYVEFVLGYDGALSSAPDREALVRLSEEPGSETRLVVRERVNGFGQDFRGAFETISGASAATGSTAESFYVSSAAFFADPEENAQEVDAEGELFRGVVGTTDLSYEVHFEIGANTPLSCIHTYPFRYNVKRSDGVFETARRYLLVVAPTATDTDPESWCPPPPGCV